MSNDKSFIIPLSRMEQQWVEDARKSAPSVDDQHQDGIKLGKVYAIQEVIKAFKNYGKD